MKYMFLIYSNENDSANISEAQQQAEMAEYFAFNAEMGKQGKLISGEGLMPIATATTLRVREGKTLTTDGPFAETKEQLGGYYLLECKDLDEAVEMAKQIPTSRHGSIEIRPIASY
jgi:hypothetical protein